MSVDPKLRRFASGVLMALALLISGCSRDDNPTRPENAPPETRLEMEGPYEIDGHQEILLQWSGSDAEGAVSHFEWRVLLENEDETTVSWQRTRAREKRLDLSTGAVAKGDLSLLFEVRALDVDGLRDPSPASGSFTSRTQAPTVQIQDLPVGNTCIASPSHVQIRWTADDPDTKHGPEASRYLVLKLGDASTACLTRAQFEMDNPFRSVSTSDPRWSDWVEYDPDDPRHPSRSLQLDGLELGHPYLIGVQARDVDGATTRTFQWGENVAHLRVTDNSQPPLLYVFEPLLGPQNHVGLLDQPRFDVVAGGELHFQWAARPANFGGYIDAYRVGRDLVDPDDPNDPGWSGPWGSTQVLDFDIPLQGSRNVVIQVRDQSGAISRGSYLFQVVQSPANRRDLLLVDDWRNTLGSPQGNQEDAAQDQAWSDLLDAIVPGAWDVIDAQSQTAELDLEAILRYRSVIWFTNASNLSFLHTRFGPDSAGNERYDWLEAAQRHSVNLMVAGPGAAFSRVKHPSQGLIFPFLFDVAARGPYGAGELELPLGEIIHRGTLRAPYRSFCVDIFDQIRPPLGGIWGERPGQILRSVNCDALLFADPATEFVARFPSAPSVVLHPTPERENLDPRLQLFTEEFYDANVTSREAAVPARDCKVPMFLLRSRRSGDLGVDPSNCSPPGETSPIEGVPVALASFAYSDTRSESGRADFIWGFNPLGFEPEGVQMILDWILRDHWELGS